jgi:hypothetical protein
MVVRFEKHIGIWDNRSYALKTKHVFSASFLIRVEMANNLWYQQV